MKEDAVGGQKKVCIINYFGIWDAALHELFYDTEIIQVGKLFFYNKFSSMFLKYKI